MSLRSQAMEAGSVLRDRSRSEQKSRNDAAIEADRRALEAALEVPATFMGRDVFRLLHQEQGQSWMQDHPVMLFCADDVVFTRAWGIHDSWTVVVSCARCGNDTLPYGGGTTPRTLSRMTWRDSTPAQRVEEIGGVLTTEWVCGPCRSRELNSRCSRCHRPYVEEES